MGSPIYVAAGGGGDALAALIYNRATVGDSHPPVVISYSWDRYLIDPTPGPRTPRDFRQLTKATAHCSEVTANSCLVSGGISGLSVLARHTNARFVLMDPTNGAVGIRNQIEELCLTFGTDEVIVVDVGGDVLARGNEPSLLSPLGDSLALAALTDLPMSTSIAVLGPGLDGELPVDQLLSELARGDATSIELRPEHVDPLVSALEYHPSEATMLVAAAAKGVAGRVEIRDKGALVQLAAASANAYRLKSSVALKTNQVAQALVDTRSFDEAETITKTICGRTELDHERRKASMMAARTAPEPDLEQLTTAIEAYCADAAERGIDLVTFRRLTEIAGKRQYHPPTLRNLVGSLALRDLPLCRTSDQDISSNRQ